MKRLLFVDHVNRILGGGEINLLELLGAPATQQQWELACACPRGSRLGEALALVHVRQYDYGFAEALNTLRLVGKRFSPLRTLRGVLALRAAQRRLEKIIREFRPDVVVSCTNKDHFCAAVACRRAGVPCVWWVNDIVSADFFSWPTRTSFYWRARRGPARLVVVSEFARAALLAAGLPAKLVTTVHNGLPLARYSRGARGLLRTPANISNDEPLIGIVGRYTPWKGQDFFLRVAQAWARENPRGHFALIGHAFNEDQAFEAELRRFVADHGLAARVHFVPFQADIAAALSDLDVLVHASVRPEPFGRVLIEAMAVGVPVLGARAGGVPEIIEHGVDGLLAAPGDCADYLAQLKTLLLPGNRAATIAAAAAQKVRARFSLDRVRQQFDGICQELG